LLTNAQEFIDLAVKQVDPKFNKLFGNTEINTQMILSTAEAQKQADRIAKSNNLTTFSYDDCINKLKQKYNINTDIIITKSEFKLLHEDGSKENTIVVNYLNSKTRERLDSSICQSVEQVNRLQLPVFLTDLEIQRYNKFKKDGIDLFDPNDPAFRTKCYSYYDNSIYYDTTLRYRRHFYFQNRTECSQNSCRYQSYINGFVICQCGLVSPPSESFGVIVLSNFSILGCSSEYFNVKIYLN
jgi:hypothetical protein